MDSTGEVIKSSTRFGHKYHEDCNENIESIDENGKPTKRLKGD